MTLRLRTRIFTTRKPNGRPSRLHNNRRFRNNIHEIHLHLCSNFTLNHPWSPRFRQQEGDLSSSLVLVCLRLYARRLLPIRRPCLPQFQCQEPSSPSPLPLFTSIQCQEEGQPFLIHPAFDARRRPREPLHQQIFTNGQILLKSMPYGRVLILRKGKLMGMGAEGGKVRTPS